MERQSLPSLLEATKTLCLALGVIQDPAEIEESLYRAYEFDPNQSEADLLELVTGRLGLRTSKRQDALTELVPLLRSGFCVACRPDSDTFEIYTGMQGRKIQVHQILAAKGTYKLASLREVQARWKKVDAKDLTVMVIERGGHVGESPEGSLHRDDDAHHHAHHHLTPLQRLYHVLRWERSDIVAIIIYGLVAGILSLASPLAVEWVVTTIGFGRYMQPLFVLAIILFVFLAFQSAMRILQTIVVEIIQRRLLVRYVSDLTHRIPVVQRKELEGVHGPELLNRFFDIISLQKSLASLLLDGVSLVLSTITGMILLAFYHPFLLGFDIILLLCMTLFTWLLGRGAIQSAIDESIIKYRLAYWMQQVIAYPSAFRLHGGHQLAIQQANSLSVGYLECRKRHFVVLLRQIVFAGALQAIASTVLLGLGGYLVITERLTMGQLVASELVVSVIVGAFAKVGKSLENFYDMMASLDKVGHLVDLKPEPMPMQPSSAKGPASIDWHGLVVRGWEGHRMLEIGSGNINAGKHTAIRAVSPDDASTFLRALAALEPIEHGYVEVDRFPLQDAALGSRGQWLGYVGKPEIFQGSIYDNIVLARAHVSGQELRTTLEEVGLWDTFSRFPGGLKFQLQAEGKMLSYEDQIRLMLVRACLANPRILLVDRAVDMLDPPARHRILDYLFSASAPWTCVMVTTHPDLPSHVQTISLTSQSV